MQFRLLGPLEAVEAGEQAALGGTKQRALLAVLLLQANRVVATERLIDALWGEEVPETAAKAVQIYVSRLRKVLPAKLLVTRAPGYLIDLDGHDLDLHRFEQLHEADDGRCLPKKQNPRRGRFAPEAAHRSITSRAGSSRLSLMRTRKVTASRPSMMR